MISPARKKQLEELQAKINVQFSSEELLNQALTHSSYVNELKKAGLSDNERLEFLGDAVLKLVISDYIFNRFRDLSEGDLTKMRAAVVSDLSLSEISKELDMGQYLMLGKNEKRSGGEKKKSNLANALESIIAAVFLDHGLGKAHELVVSLLKNSIDRASAKDFIIDYKSALQELSQKNKWGLPVYTVAKEFGPKHKRLFLIEVRVKGARSGSGRGYSKKEAEQNAAKEALSLINQKGLRNKPAVPPVQAAQKAGGLLMGIFQKRRRRIGDTPN